VRATYRSTIGRLLSGVACISMALILCFLKVSLSSFQKVVTIAPVSALPTLQLPAVAGPDMRALITAIPYADSRTVYDILPGVRYQRTIEQGLGNCSNLAFGLAYWLNGHDHDYQVVHFIPPESFVLGQGHTVLNMPFVLDGAAQLGLVDLLEGGIPLMHGQPVTLAQLQRRPLHEVSVLPLNPRMDAGSDYYGDFLSDAVIGVVPAASVQRYFRFIEAVYVPLGNRKLERILFGGLAVLVGQFPETLVLRNEYERLYVAHPLLFTTAPLLLWLMRLLPFLLVLWLLLKRSSPGPTALAQSDNTDAVHDQPATRHS
jgi:hypothetical protein